MIEAATQNPCPRLHMRSKCCGLSDIKLLNALLCPLPSCDTPKKNAIVSHQNHTIKKIKDMQNCSTHRFKFTTWIWTVSFKTGCPTLVVFFIGSVRGTRELFYSNESVHSAGVITLAEWTLSSK